MTTILTLVVAASALAFFGCFFLALCHDQRNARNHPDVVEVIRLAEKAPVESVSPPKSA